MNLYGSSGCPLVLDFDGRTGLSGASCSFVLVGFRSDLLLLCSICFPLCVCVAGFLFCVSCVCSSSDLLHVRLRLLLSASLWLLRVSCVFSCVVQVVYL
ncbi:hypothetical protein MtrunA17_Chr4g0021551 [Medicago truncatula]|uniref:Transmembrane protein n=1 Tax=Medicago truncatula TaxID=3880 RepID=A0A396I5N4_MEDTR|nr:hypothetical protein MtrunA17_Chr4g0021551 [Medicago truncatula]